MSDPVVDVPSDQSPESAAVVPKKYFFIFCLTTTLFALWGFANDFTNPLVKAFQQIFQISTRESSWVQMAFYGGYASMAIPAALVIRKFGYKFGIIVGLALYAIGALLTIPASMQMQFSIFLVGFYVLTFGLAFLETTANPFILSMGPPETATRRLNLAQAFNPIGSLTGMLIASQFVLPQLGINDFAEKEKAAHPEYEQMLPSEVGGLINEAFSEFAETEKDEFQEMQAKDLRIVRIPYVTVAVILIALLLVFAFSKFPQADVEHDQIELGQLVGELTTMRYLGGVVAQAFYVGAQIMCWTYIIHYGMTLHGMSIDTAQKWNIAAMIIFLCSRFICTFLLQYLNAGVLLGILAIGGLLLTLGTIYIESIVGMYCLVGISACMSLMFPTIYGLALDGINPEDAKLASAGLIFAIVGGAVMPFLQADIIDKGTVELFGSTLESVRASFFLPAICFVVIAIYGFASSRPRTA
ncbi:L-fucose:H+ symporter permease [Adhaeretor mobilis]|uniref:L-fucose-proton symporter n=1 Tax=Adhaeretor mobilis TaxID=1930276 RepID=A0A517MR85_9BACT|nr:L-fucose:H+ symporter permease [Adhaeretor mobilis]QDS97394.1 L-fucose-proton symporter [Adhaeretor mobilis]